MGWINFIKNLEQKSSGIIGLASRHLNCLLLLIVCFTELLSRKKKNKLNINFMRKKILLIFGSLIIIILMVSSSCNKQPYKPDYKNIRGYVIGKETCNTDESKDFWLIDFTYGSENPKVGDTLNFNGNTYTNVLKTRGLDQQLKILGLRVSIDYRIISADKVVTTGCNAPSPVTFNLKELTILNQGEIR